MTRVAMAGAALVVAGCAFMPKDYARLDEAREVHMRAAADPQVALHAGAELRLAGQVLESAVSARNTLADPAVVEHLAYLAKQRTVISIEVATLRSTCADRHSPRGSCR
jgi:starvation-inducible outer membrane lipoprotein